MPMTTTPQPPKVSRDDLMKLFIQARDEYRERKGIGKMRKKLKERS